MSAEKPLEKFLKKLIFEKLFKASELPNVFFEKFSSSKSLVMKMHWAPIFKAKKTFSKPKKIVYHFPSFRSKNARARNLSLTIEDESLAYSVDSECWKTDATLKQQKEIQLRFQRNQTGTNNCIFNSF